MNKLWILLTTCVAAACGSAVSVEADGQGASSGLGGAADGGAPATTTDPADQTERKQAAWATWCTCWQGASFDKTLELRTACINKQKFFGECFWEHYRPEFFEAIADCDCDHECAVEILEALPSSEAYEAFREACHASCTTKLNAHGPLCDIPPAYDEQTLQHLATCLQESPCHQALDCWPCN